MSPNSLCGNGSSSQQLRFLPWKILYESSCISWCSLTVEGPSGLGFVAPRDAPSHSRDQLYCTPER